MAFLISKKCFGSVAAAIFVLALFQLANSAESSSLNLPEGGAMFAREETDPSNGNGWSLTDLVYGVRSFWKADGATANVEGNDSQQACYVTGTGDNVVRSAGCDIGRSDLSVEKNDGNNNKEPSKNVPLHLRLKPKHREIPVYTDDEF